MKFYICSDGPHTHNFVTHHLSPQHLSHTTLSHTIFHTQLCHTLSFTQLCHTHTHHLSHTTLSHTHTHNFVLLLGPPPPPLPFLSSLSPLQHLVLIIGRLCHVGLSGPLTLCPAMFQHGFDIRPKHSRKAIADQVSCKHKNFWALSLIIRHHNNLIENVHLLCIWHNSRSRLCKPTAAYNILWPCNVSSAFPTYASRL